MSHFIDAINHMSIIKIKAFYNNIFFDTSIIEGGGN